MNERNERNEMKTVQRKVRGLVGPEDAERELGEKPKGRCEGRRRGRRQTEVLDLRMCEAAWAMLVHC